MTDDSETARRQFWRRHLPHQIPGRCPIFVTWNLKGALPRAAMQAVERLAVALKNSPRRKQESERERRLRHALQLFTLRDQLLHGPHERSAAHRRDRKQDRSATDDAPYPRCPTDEQPSVPPPLSRNAAEVNPKRRRTAASGPVWLHDPAAAATVVESLLWGIPRRYSLRAWVVMPNHVHVILTPFKDLSVITQGIKGWTAWKINAIQNCRGRRFWQDESFDHWPRDEAEMHRIIRYIEDNPVNARLCDLPEAWRWSSAFWRQQLSWRAGESFNPEWKHQVLHALRAPETRSED